MPFPECPNCGAPISGTECGYCDVKFLVAGMQMVTTADRRPRSSIVERQPPTSAIKIAEVEPGVFTVKARK